MIKNTGKGLTDIKADLSLEGVNRKIDDISKWIKDCPFAWGNDNPENLVYGNLGDLYVDKKTGAVYKKKYNSGENNGWVELNASDEKEFGVFEFSNQAYSSNGAIVVFKKKFGNINFNTGTSGQIKLSKNKNYGIIASPQGYGAGAYMQLDLVDNFSTVYGTMLDIDGNYGLGYNNNTLNTLLLNFQGEYIYIIRSNGNGTRTLSSYKSNMIIFEL